MDNSISDFLQFGTLILACAVYVVTLVIRRVVETAVPSIKKQADVNDPKISYKTVLSRWWNEVILYLIPVVVGCLFGLINASFMFGDAIQTIPGRIVFGGVIGSFSGVFYKVIKKLIISKTGVTTEVLPTE